MAGKPSLLTVLPALNEAQTLAHVIDEIRAAVPESAILVVDDGSSDGTADVARANGAAVLQLPFNVGVGGALRAGLLHAQRNAIGIAVQCDADGQHPPTSIRDLVHGLEQADIVIGARFAGTGAYRVRGPRNWAMLLLATVMSRVHRTELTDVTSGFRAFGPRAIAVLCRELPPDYLGDTVEALIIAKEHGLRVRQVPVAMRARQGGVASHHPLRAMLYLFRALLILALSLLRLVGTRLRRRRR